jgi:hypothetical protein
MIKPDQNRPSTILTWISPDTTGFPLNRLDGFLTRRAHEKSYRSKKPPKNRPEIFLIKIAKSLDTKSIEGFFDVK